MSLVDPSRKSSVPFAVMQKLPFDMLECRPRPEGKAHEATGIHYASRWRGSRVAADGPLVATSLVSSFAADLRGAAGSGAQAQAVGL